MLQRAQLLQLLSLLQRTRGQRRQSHQDISPVHVKPQMNEMQPGRHGPSRLVPNDGNRRTRKVECIAVGIGHDLDDARIVEILNGVNPPLECRHAFAGRQTGLNQVGQEIGIEQNFISLKVEKILPGMITSQSRHAVGPGSIRFLHQDGTPAEALDRGLDPFVIGGHDDLRDGPAQSGPLVHVLDHGLSHYRDERLPGKTR